ncbi:MAG: sigma-70 family RNA polymerase sigma factor [Acidimicrobiia bacterium]|nr:sigma-70 family RNA polymerase sigma factor [Acidimicrobiia bacterium]
MTSDEEFEKFFTANFDRLVRSVTAISGDAEVATDSVQDAFIKAYARWSQLKKYDDPTLWVRRVAINKSRDTRRSFLRRRAREDRFDDPTVAEQAVVWQSDAEIDVEGVLHQLSPRQRSVAALFYLEDLSVAEIAASLDISDGAVKFHLNKARTSLRVLLGHESVGDT